jgi:hypothetical protein
VPSISRAADDRPFRPAPAPSRRFSVKCGSKISTSQGQIRQQSLRSKGASRGLAALDSLDQVDQADGDDGRAARSLGVRVASAAVRAATESVGGLAWKTELAWEERRAGCCWPS